MPADTPCGICTCRICPFTLTVIICPGIAFAGHVTAIISAAVQSPDSLNLRHTWLRYVDNEDHTCRDALRHLDAHLLVVCNDLYRTAWTSTGGTLHAHLLVLWLLLGDYYGLGLLYDNDTCGCLRVNLVRCSVHSLV